MEYNSTYEQEIDLKDLMFAVLRKWKFILLFGVLGALVLGGYKGFSTYKESTGAAESAEMKYQEDLLAYEKNSKRLESEINNIVVSIADQEEYLENSILLKISPYDICEAKADVFVVADEQAALGVASKNADYSDAILRVYRSFLTSDEVREEIADKLGTEPRYLSELVSVETEDQILSVSVKYTNKEDAKYMLDTMLDCMEDLKPQAVSAIGGHTVHIVNRSVSSYVDLEYAEVLANQKKKLTDLEANLKSKEEEFAKLAEPVKGGAGMAAVMKPAVKFALVGGVAGAFVIVFGVCVIFLMSDKVYSSKDLKNRYGMKVLGALPGKTCKCPADQLLNKLEGRVFEENEAVRNALIAQNVRNTMGDAKKLLVLGSADASEIEVVANAMKVELPEIEVVSGGNMLRDVGTLKKLPECDGVVLVETCGVSSYGDIELELEKVKDLGKSVVGCVVIG